MNPGIGLTWEPKTSFFPSFGINGAEEKPSASLLSTDKSLWKPNSELVDGLYVPPNDPKIVNKMIRKERKDTTGNNWFDMAAATITPEVKKDLQLLKLRNVIDPKRHYKKGSSNKIPKYFQVGTVVESSMDFYSGRLTKKERKNTFADELLSSDALNAYRKRKVREIEEKNKPGGNPKWKIMGKSSRKRAKERRR